MRVKPQWDEVIPLALHDLARSEDPLVVQSALGVIAMGRGLERNAETLLEFTDGLAQMLSQ